MHLSFSPDDDAVKYLTWTGDNLLAGVKKSLRYRRLDFEGQAECPEKGRERSILPLNANG